MIIHRTSLSNQQRGMTLIVTLLFLVLISMLAITSFNSSTTNMRVTGNMMVRQESLAAAQSVIEQTLSNMMFTSDPVAIAANPYDVDIDGDANPDYQARLSPAPTCQRVRVIKVNELVPGTADDACQRSGVSSFSGIDDASLNAKAGDSLCSNTEWNIRATVTDANSGTTVAVNQGVGVRVPTTDANDFCI
jgi:Tfp pilus assembly protein PilV